jgi:hypothetical protein
MSLEILWLPSRLLEISSADVSGGRWQITALTGFSEFEEKVKYWRLFFFW